MATEKLETFTARIPERMANWKQWAATREKYRQALKRAALLEQNGAKRVTFHFSGKTEKPRQEA